jgi:EAL domain-containing protein (putative c-di-GMP-specific phosphodiesterase class I)
VIASALTRLGCDIAQGFWISAPLGPQMLRRWPVTHDPRRWVP